MDPWYTKLKHVVECASQIGVGWVLVTTSVCERCVLSYSP